MDSIATAASGPFVLLVGPHRQKFIMQSEVVANQCSALKMLVNGPMREGISQEADWKSVSVPTFMCFRSFAYTRDYELPKPCSETTTKPVPIESSPKADEYELPKPCSETTTKPVPIESSPKADEFRLNAGTSSSLWSDLPEGLPKRNAEQESVPANIQADVPADNDFWAPVSKKDRKKKKKSKNKQDEAWTQFIARQKTDIGEIPNQRRARLF